MFFEEELAQVKLYKWKNIMLPLGIQAMRRGTKEELSEAYTRLWERAGRGPRTLILLRNFIRVRYYPQKKRDKE